MDNVRTLTVEFDKCIGCGVCAASCACDAIAMKLNKYKEWTPVIDNKKCTGCGICASFCPHTSDALIQKALDVSSAPDRHAHGIENASYFIAWDKNEGNRRRSASGGVITAFASQLLKARKIDAVIHGKMVENTRGGLHYEASLSRTPEEMDSKRSSYYFPLTFSEMLLNIRNTDRTCLIIGTPCFISAVTKLCGEHPSFTDVKIITIALICSHNVNGQYTDFLSESLKIPGATPYKANLRYKDAEMLNHDNFYTCYFNERDGILVKKNRFETRFTESWRNYYFAMNVCNYCSDFWGKDADISVKDAWGKWSEDTKDVLGKSMVIIRNKALLELFTENGGLIKEEINIETVRSSQMQTTSYKQEQAYNKNFKSLFSKENIKNGLLMNYWAGKLSRVSYRLLGYRATSLLMRLYVLNKQLARHGGKKAYGFIRFALNITLVMPVYRFTRNLLFYSKTTGNNKILVLGGYGGGHLEKNSGDEAQLNQTLEILYEKFPGHVIKVLTPDQNQTHIDHFRCAVSDAPRISFFDMNTSPMYWLTSRFQRLHFILRCIFIYFNAALDKRGLPTILLNSKRAALLYELRTSDLVYFSGGGFLTGATLSRLWDGCFFMMLAKLYKVPVVLSGQTIGLWRNRLDRYIAKKGLGYASLITVRDPEASLDDLSEIGLKGDHIYQTFDDALFCQKIEDKEALKGLLLATGMSDAQINKGFVTFNFHYWGTTSDEERESLLEKLYSIYNSTQMNSEYSVLLLPMVRTDIASMDDFISKYKPSNTYMFRSDFDFKKIRAVIGASEMCITMKHHPIIFSIGEKVPAMSLAFRPYYEHKNRGALEIFQLGKYSVVLTDSNFIDDFDRLYRELLNETNNIKSNLDNRFKELISQKEEFLNKVEKILRGHGH